MLAPTLRFGSSHHHIPFGGTLSLSTETYYRVLCELGESFILAGFKRLFVLNGHGGNNELIQLAARDLALKHSVSIVAAAYWTIAWDNLVAEKAHEHGLLPGHAGIFETSQMMALRPELVEESRPHRDSIEKSDPRSFFGAYRVETHGAWQAIDGYSDSPDQARSQLGKTWLVAGVRSIARVFLEFYAGQCEPVSAVEAASKDNQKADRGTSSSRNPGDRANWPSVGREQELSLELRRNEQGVSQSIAISLEAIVVYVNIDRIRESQRMHRSLRALSPTLAQV